MTLTLTLSQAATVYGGTLVAPDCEFTRVSTDSRTLEQGELFVALSGDNFDGHQFLSSVQGKACGAVVERYVREIDMPQWVVPNAVKALGQLAAMRRAQLEIPVIAITGSSGKTTVKEMVASILSEKGRVLATRGNFNNHIGVPLTLFELNADDEYAVIEMGASAAGEIAYLCTLASPGIVVVNNVLPAHVAGFGSVDGIARAKGEIYEGVPAGGTAILNTDESYRNDWLSSCSARNLLTFSLQESADFTATDLLGDSNGCYGFELKTPAGSRMVQLAIPGKHNVANSLAAAACAFAAGASADDIAAGLAKLAPIKGRMNTLPGVNGSVVIDDSYNANPGSMAAAINALSELAGKRVLVVGDMGELGADAAVSHGEVGRYAKRHGIEMLLATGALSVEAVREFGEGAQHFESKSALAEYLKAQLNEQSRVLIKGSRSAGMETVVQAITKDEEG